MSLTKAETLIALGNGEKIRAISGDSFSWVASHYIRLEEDHLVNDFGTDVDFSILEGKEFEIWKKPIKYVGFETAFKDMNDNASIYSHDESLT